jgi:hypothetical protein
MPYSPHLVPWVQAEVEGLTAAPLDFADPHPDREWMGWSIRRQVSHLAWDSLVFPHRRCAKLLWPDGNDPTPMVWAHHPLGPAMTSDRLLDAALFWHLPDRLAKLELGLAWLERVVTEPSMATLRATVESVRGTYFWRYVIQTLPRGAGVDPARAGCLRYDLEGSLWMVFYEILAHIRTIPRLKRHQNLPLVELSRGDYLRLPEYWGETDRNGPSMQRL